ncbi:MAG: hypothetical protein K940chlam1_01192, partial [Candidatus Anoxychlamydiales bacterium]|nr:hypothetical protein [Candidatus Anoxychlamydiales bacterium]
MEEIKKSRGLIQRLKKNDLGFKIILGIVFWICFATLCHFKQVRVQVFDLQSLSPKYLLSPVDFNFPDDEKTTYLRYDKTSKINYIYYIDEKKAKQSRSRFEKYLIDNPKWGVSVSYEKINDYADLFENILLKSRFSDARTIKLMKKNRIDVSNYLALNLENNKESSLPKGYFSILSKKLVAEVENISEETLNFIITYFKENNYSLRVDYLTQSKIKKIIEKNISQQYTHVNEGELIIAKNEKVTSRHIVMLQAMKVAISKKINLFEPSVILGNILYSFIFIFLMIFYLKIEQPEILGSLKQLSLICTILILTFVFAKIMEFVIFKSSGAFLEIIQYPIIVPF